MLRLFLRFFGPPWSVAERKTENRAAALRDLLRICETVCHGTHIAEGAELLAVRQTVFCYRKFLCSGTDPSLRLLL